MSILSREEYRELFEAVDEYSEVVSLLSDGGLSVDFSDRPEEVDELNSVGAAFYRSDFGDFYAVASHMGEEALEHLEKGGSVEKYLTAMEWQEKRFEEVYGS